MRKSYKFSLEKFEEAMESTEYVIEEVVEQFGTLYVIFTDTSNLKYISASIKYSSKNNCINIYHHKNSKNKYCWSGELDYINLARDIEKYDKEGKDLY